MMTTDFVEQKYYYNLTKPYPTDTRYKRFLARVFGNRTLPYRLKYILWPFNEALSSYSTRFEELHPSEPGGRLNWVRMDKDKFVTEYEDDEVRLSGVQHPYDFPESNPWVGNPFQKYRKWKERRRRKKIRK